MKKNADNKDNQQEELNLYGIAGCSALRKMPIEFIKHIHDDKYLKETLKLTRDQIKRRRELVYHYYKQIGLPKDYKVIDDSDYAIHKDGTLVRISYRKIIKQCYDNKGYKIYSVAPIPNNTTRRVHRVLMFIFNPPTDPTKNQVNHIDGVKDNNKLENLEWCNNSENVQHAFDNGLIDTRKISKNQTGEGNSVAKLTDKQAKDIKYKFRNINANILGKKYKVSAGTIRGIWAARNWTHI